jgi:hypothetical protein
MENPGQFSEEINMQVAAEVSAGAQEKLEGMRKDAGAIGALSERSPVLPRGMYERGPAW